MSEINWYTLYKPETGEITGTFTAFEEMVEPNTPQGYSVIQGEYFDDHGYIFNNQFVPYPQKPGQFYKFDYSTKQWVQDLEEAKASKWSNIKNTRDIKEFGGFYWNNLKFDSDSISQSRISGAVQLANLYPNYSVVWTLADNSTVALSSAEIVAVGIALANHVSTQHEISRQLRDQLNLAATIEQVNSINWPSA